MILSLVLEARHLPLPSFDGERGLRRSGGSSRPKRTQQFADAPCSRDPVGVLAPFDGIGRQRRGIFGLRNGTLWLVPDMKQQESGWPFLFGVPRSAVGGD